MTDLPVTLDTVGNVLTEIEDAFFDIPFENSDFQTRAFVVASQQTPARAYRAIGLQMFSKIQAVKEYKVPVVLVGDEPMNTNESPAYYNKERATYDESVDYICNELEIAANYIPLRVTVSQFGRPTRGAAYALIARLRLQQASPLFNGGSAAKTTFGGWIRKSDNLPYKARREMSHDISVTAITSVEFNKLSINDFNVSDYYPKGYTVEPYRYGNKNYKYFS